MSIAKTIVQLLAAVLAAVLPGLLVEQPLGVTGWINIIVLAAGAVHVFNSANIPGWNIAKSIASAVAALGVLLISVLADGGVSPAEWVQISTAFVGTVAVYFTPNAGTRTVTAP